MKKLFYPLSFLFVLLLSVYFTPLPVYSQGGGGISISVARKFVIYTTLPATCAAGQVAYQISDTSFYGCTSTNTWHLLGTSGGSGTVTSIVFSAPLTGGTVTTTGTVGCATCTITIASGTKALATSLIASGACSAAQTATATGTLTTDSIAASFNADPTGVTGYTPSTSGGLYIVAYPTADLANFKVCNNTSAGITPGAITLNFRVTR